MLASARTIAACERFVRQVNPYAVISNGGALVRVGDDVIYRAAVDAETLNRLMRKFMKTFDIGYITADTSKGYFVNKPVDENDPAWKDFPPVSCVDFSADLDCEAYSIAIEITDADSARAIADEFLLLDTVPFSGEGWFRYANKAANKWNGIKALMEHADIETENVAAFGDDFIDIEMLTHCGVGVAVGNAIDEAKAAADFICDTNDNEGVAKWIEENIL